MIQLVLFAIPNYSMSVFLYPKLFTAKLNSLLSRFWWDGNVNSSKIQWISWQRLCISKFHGSLDFKDFEYFNLACLVK